MISNSFHLKDHHLDPEFQGKTRRSISFCENSPEVFEVSTRPIIIPDFSSQDSITQKFSQFSTFSNTIEKVSRDQATMHFRDYSLEKHSSELLVKKAELEKSEISEFFCVTLETPKTFTEACGCKIF